MCVPSLVRKAPPLFALDSGRSLPEPSHGDSTDEGIPDEAVFDNSLMVVALPKAPHMTYTPPAAEGSTVEPTQVCVETKYLHVGSSAPVSRLARRIV